MGADRRGLRRLMCGAAFVAPALVAGTAPGFAQTTPAIEAPSASSEAPDQSQPPPPEPDSAPIIITGSRIPRPNLTAVSPVAMVSQDEVKLEGSIMVEELLDQLPQVAPSQGAFISNGALGIATVDLRNLGPARTLVLVNGRRLGPGDPGTPLPDLNMIPSTLIKRVEVLTGGATSVYGSDAVSGVVNFILDTRLEGLRLDAQASVFQHDNRDGSGLRAALEQRGFPFPDGNSVDGGRRDVNLAWGKGFFDDRVHISVYGGYRKLEPLTQDRRDYSACTAQPRPPDFSQLVCGGSFASAPANFLTNFNVFTVGPDRTFVPGFTRFNFGPYNYYQRSDRRYTAGGFFDAEISDSMRPYLEVMFLDDRSTAQIAPSANFGNTTTINCDNPLLSAQQLALICFDGNFFGQQVLFDNDGNVVEIQGAPIPFTDPVTGATFFKGVLEVDRRAVESGGRQDDLRHKTLRIVGGIKGDVARGLSYDASYLRNRAKMTDRHLNDFSISRLTRALDVVTDPATGQPVCRSVLTGDDPACVPWDIFSLAPVSPEATAYLNVPTLVRGTVTEQVANVNMTAQLGEWGIRSPWAEEGPAVNFGAEYRKDRLDFIPDELSQSGDLAGLSTSINPVHGATEVKELFVEGRIPIVTGRLIDRLAFEGGYRHSNYKAGSARFTTNAYKIAFDLTPVNGVRLRASQQRAVRAPNIVELFYPPFVDFFFTDPCTGTEPEATFEQCALSGVTAEQYGRLIPIANDGLQAYNALAGGNIDLQPEIALTRTAGIVLEPRFLPGFNATVDWWDIRLDDAISSIFGDFVLSNCLNSGDPLFCSRIHRDPNGSLRNPGGFVDTKLFNIGSLRVRGIDIAANYRRDLGRFGSGAIEFLGSYVDKFSVDNGGQSEIIDCTGRHGSVCGPPTPRWRHKARASWTMRSGLTLSVHWRHIGKLRFRDLPEEPVTPLTARIPAQNYFDASMLARLKKNYALRMGVNNIFDREPPLVVSGAGSCFDITCNGNTYPQWYDPLGRYFFAGVTIDFR